MHTETRAALRAVEREILANIRECRRFQITETIGAKYLRRSDAEREEAFDRYWEAADSEDHEFYDAQEGQADGLRVARQIVRRQLGCSHPKTERWSSMMTTGCSACGATFTPRTSAPWAPDPQAGERWRSEKSSVVYRITSRRRGRVYGRQEKPSGKLAAVSALDFERWTWEKVAA